VKDRSKGKLTFALDVDDVLADLITEWLARYRRESGHKLYPDDLTEWSMSAQVKPEWKSKIYDFLKDPLIYHNVKPIDGALDAVERIRRHGHDVLFVTSCVVGSTDAKMQWLLRNNFCDTKQQVEKEFVAARQKHRILADCLVDDRIDNVEGFTGFDRRAFLVTRPHNRSTFTAVPRIAGVHEALDAMYDRLGWGVAA
jgi:5'(3')-deoxyribonucleotidase